MLIHIVDGTYELCRHFHGLRRVPDAKDGRKGKWAAAVGVLNGVLEMIEGGATHIGVATDHVIESFRNDLWPGYKTGAGIDAALRLQFWPLEDGLRAMGVAVWPMTELEADDAMATAAHRAAADAAVWRSEAPELPLSTIDAGSRSAAATIESDGARPAPGVQQRSCNALTQTNPHPVTAFRFPFEEAPIWPPIPHCHASMPIRRSGFLWRCSRAILN